MSLYPCVPSRTHPEYLSPDISRFNSPEPAETSLEPVSNVGAGKWVNNGGRPGSFILALALGPENMKGKFAYHYLFKLEI